MRIRTFINALFSSLGREINLVSGKDKISLKNYDANHPSDTGSLRDTEVVIDKEQIYSRGNIVHIEDIGDEHIKEIIVTGDRSDFWSIVIILADGSRVNFALDKTSGNLNFSKTIPGKFYSLILRGNKWVKFESRKGGIVKIPLYEVEKAKVKS